MYVYYIIAGIIIILLNMLVVPAVQERSVQKTDYSAPRIQTMPFSARPSKWTTRIL